MIKDQEGGLFWRMAPERAQAVYAAHPLRWPILERHPVAVAVLLVVVVLCALEVETAFGDASPERASLYGTLLRAGLCAVLVWSVARAGLLRAIGLTSPPVWRSAWLLWLPMLLLAVVLVSSIANGETTDDGRWIGLSAVQVLFVGLLEELLARGVVLFLLLYAWREREHGVVAAVLASSAAFGAAHLINSLFGSATPWETTLIQVTYATLIGIGLAALVLRTNTLWPGILWHAAIDFVGIGLAGPPESPTDTPTAADASLTPIVVTAPLLIYGLVLVRRRTSPATAQSWSGGGGG